LHSLRLFVNRSFLGSFQLAGGVQGGSKSNSLLIKLTNPYRANSRSHSFRMELCITKHQLQPPLDPFAFHRLYARGMKRSDHDTCLLLIASSSYSPPHYRYPMFNDVPHVRDHQLLGNQPCKLLFDIISAVNFKSSEVKQRHVPRKSRRCK
jgi:hypothetical protein